MSRTAPNSAFGRESWNDVINGSAPGVARAATSNTEIVPYWVPTARYVPVLEKQAAKLPLLLSQRPVRVLIEMGVMDLLSVRSSLL